MANEFKVKKGLVVDGTGTVLDIQGTQGQLFSVTDSLTGDLFSVSDISGIPILNVNSSGVVSVDGSLRLDDSNKIQLGDSQDLELYHDGTHSYISDNGTGELRFIANGATRFKIGSDVASLSGTDFAIGAARKLYLDGQSNTYITESSADTVKFFVGGQISLTLTDNAAFAGNISTLGQVSIADATTYARLNLSGAQANGISYSLYTAIPGVSNSGFTIRRTSGGDSNVLYFDGSNNATFVGTIGATNFSGSHSGTSTNTNTGDQTLPTDFVSAASGGTFGGAVTVTGELEATSLDINGNADISGIITSKRSINFTTAIASSYVKILQVSTDSNQLASVVRLSATGHGGSHVGAWSADILVNHSQDITVKSQSGNYTLGTIKIQSNGNGEYHVLFKSTSSTSTTYYFTADSLTHTCTMSGNPTSTPSTTSIHEHVLNFGTNFTQQDNGSLTNGKANFGCEVEATSLDINGAADISGNVNISGSFVGNSSYHEFGNNTANVSNDGGWNGRLNVAGTGHARLDVRQSTGDAIITTMYSHDGHATGKIGTMSNHSLTFMCNGNNKGSISTGGTLTMTGDVVAYSDKKLKENVKTLDGSKVLKMRGVSFDRIDTGVSSSGVIAQEMQEVAPELVNETDGTLGVSYGNITGYLIEAIKEQQKQIDELKKLIKDGNNL